MAAGAAKDLKFIAKPTSCAAQKTQPSKPKVPGAFLATSPMYPAR